MTALADIPDLGPWLGNLAAKKKKTLSWCSHLNETAGLPPDDGGPAVVPACVRRSQYQNHRNYTPPAYKKLPFSGETLKFLKCYVQILTLGEFLKPHFGAHLGVRLEAVMSNLYALYVHIFR